MQRKGRADDAGQRDSGLEVVQVQRSNSAGAFLAFVLLLIMVIMYAERSEIFEALAGAKAYMYGSLVNRRHADEDHYMDELAAYHEHRNHDGDHEEGAQDDGGDEAWDPAQAARSRSHSRRQGRGNADGDGDGDGDGDADGDAGTADATAAAAGATAAAAAAAPPRVITEVTLRNNTIMQILDEPIPQDCYPEQHADYDGPAVKWGLGNKARSAAECCRQCKEFRPGPGGQPCNVWVWCGDPSGVCWSMDIHTHTTGDCWLKYQAAWDGDTDRAKSNLVVNHRTRFSDDFRKEHKTAPELVPWVAGVIPPQRSRRQLSRSQRL